MFVKGSKSTTFNVPALGESLIIVGLDHLISVHNDGDEKWEDHVDEEHDKGVEVDPRECVNQPVFGWHHAECGEHIVTVDQGKEGLRGRW